MNCRSRDCSPPHCRSAKLNEHGRVGRHMKAGSFETNYFLLHQHDNQVRLIPNEYLPRSDAEVNMPFQSIVRLHLLQHAYAGSCWRDIVQRSPAAQLCWGVREMLCFVWKL